MYETDYFHKKKKQTWILFIVILVLFVISTMISKFNFGQAIFLLPEGILWLFKNFIPTENSISFLPLIFNKLLETILMSIAATTTAAIMAFLFSILGSQKLGLNNFFKIFVRLVASFFRNMPIVVWAMILLLSFKQSEFTGYLAITFTTFGYLTRSFVETIDEQSGTIIEALKASGATYFQIIFQGVIPMASSQLISWVLFMIENNIRDATLVGMLTGTGIGFLFDLYYKRFSYDVVGMIILVIMVVVICIELLSNKIRRIII